MTTIAVVSMQSPTITQWLLGVIMLALVGAVGVFLLRKQLSMQTVEALIQEDARKYEIIQF